MSNQQPKVLWMCNRSFSKSADKASGTWLSAMANGLLGKKQIELGIVAWGSNSTPERQDWGPVPQWLVPGSSRIGRDGLPSRAIQRMVLEAASEFRPDLIHVWGTELFWGLFTGRKLLKVPALLSMQGLMVSFPELYCGRLNWRERMACIGPKEILRHRTLESVARKYSAQAKLEAEMICSHQFIAYQSPWTAGYVRTLNPSSRIYMTDRMLRPAFYTAAWRDEGYNPNIFFTAPGPAPWKGLHVAVRALAILRKRLPDVRLRVAGLHQQIGLRQEGYMRWVNRLVRRLGVFDAIDWLGPLSAEQIINELCTVGAVLIPTFVETYCVALAEALTVGAPTVVSYTGGTSYLGKDEETCLFSLAGDPSMCAYQVERLLLDRELARRLSMNAREAARSRHDPDRLVSQQYQIYEDILRQTSGSGGTA